MSGSCQSVHELLTASPLEPIRGLKPGGNQHYSHLQPFQFKYLHSTRLREENSICCKLKINLSEIYFPRVESQTHSFAMRFNLDV